MTLNRSCRFIEMNQVIHNLRPILTLYRTGRFLYALGNVAASREAWEDSFRYHERALQQFLSTIGKSHHRTGDVQVRMARHFLRMGLLDKARWVFGIISSYKADFHPLQQARRRSPSDIPRARNFQTGTGARFVLEK